LARSKRSLGKLVLVIVLGAVIGTLFGEVVSFALPDGVVKEFFVKSIEPGIAPTTLNVILFTLTIGVTIKINMVGFLGIGIAIYILRWY